GAPRIGPTPIARARGGVKLVAMKKLIHLNAFNQCAAALQSFGQFRNPRDRTSQGYTSTRFWVELARLLESGGFDSLFFADVHGAYDVYRGSAEAGIRHAVQFPGNDPTVLFPAMAQATRHLDLQHLLLPAIPYRQTLLVARSFHRRAGRLEHRDLVPRQRLPQRDGRD